MINLDNSAKIYKPIKQVFDFVSDPENDFEWQYGTLETARLSKNENAGLGSLFRSIGHVMGRRALSAFEVTEYEPNKRYSFKSLSGPLKLKTTFTFEVDAGRTNINISTQVKADGAFGMDERALEKMMKKQVKDDLAMLKDILEKNGI